MEQLLWWVVALPRVGAVAVRLLPRSRDDRAPVVSVWVTRGVLALSLPLWVGFDRSAAGYQFVTSRPWRPGSGRWRSLGVDGIALFFVLLTTLLTPLCIVASWRAIGRRRRIYYACFRARETLILVVFTARDVRVFYVAFEAVLIPRFIIVGRYGSRERRVRAAFFFFLYTLLGSVLRLLARLLRYFERGTRDIAVLSRHGFGERRQLVLWLAFFASFAVKVPRVPVHIWLPEAHVEAPTAGSVILAGILLKLGTYGCRRLLLPLFPYATVYFTPLVYTLAVVAIVYTSLTAIRQSDRKRVIAYASVAHRNRTLVGLFSLTVEGVEGALLQRLSHGLVSGALFLCVGVLYDRHHSRRIHYYGGVAHTRPLFVACFLFFTRANIALPGTSSFVGEFRILVGIFQVNTGVAFLSATGRILGGAYALWLFNRIAYGNLKVQYVGSTLVAGATDVDRREVATLLPLAVLTLWRGVYPQVFLDTRHASCANLVAHRDRRA